MPSAECHTRNKFPRPRHTTVMGYQIEIEASAHALASIFDVSFLFSTRTRTIVAYLLQLAGYYPMHH